MSSRANATRGEPQTQANTLTGRLLFVLALLAAIGTLSTNIILPSLAPIAHSMAVPVRDVGLLLSSFFITGVADAVRIRAGKLKHPGLRGTGRGAEDRRRSNNAAGRYTRCM